MDNSCQPGGIVQHPYRGPAAAAVTDPPGGQAFGQGALAAAQDLGGHAQQDQGFVAALDLALG